MAIAEAEVLISPGLGFTSPYLTCGFGVEGDPPGWLSPSARFVTARDADQPTLDERIQLLRRGPVDQLVRDLIEREELDVQDIALVAGVSRAALWKWRKGEAQPSRNKLKRLCSLGAFCERIRALGGVPSQWLQAELDERDGESSHLRVADVLAAGEFHAALAHFGRELSDAALLDRVFPRRSQRALLDIEWVVSPTGQDAEYLAIARELGDLFGSGQTREDAEVDLLSTIVDYVDEWFADLRKFEPHRQRAGLILDLSTAIDEGVLQETVFGA